MIWIEKLASDSGETKSVLLFTRREKKLDKKVSVPFSSETERFEEIVQTDQLLVEDQVAYFYVNQLAGVNLITGR